MFGIRIENNPNYHQMKNFFDIKQIETRPLFYPINRHDHLSHIKCKVDIANILNNECLILPSYPELREVEIEYIADCVKEYIKL